jgi:hypothetical protein
VKRFTDAALLAPLLLLFVLQMLPPRSMCGFPIGYVHSRRHVGPALVVLCVIGGPLALSLPRQLRVVATVVIAIVCWSRTRTCQAEQRCGGSWRWYSWRLARGG